MLGAGQAHGLHIGEEHPVEKEAVVPVDDEPDAVAQRECRPEVVGAGQLHQSEHHGKSDEQCKALFEQHGLGEELRRHTLMCLEIFLLYVFLIVVNPPHGVLHERNQNHGRERGGHDEGFDDDDGTVHIFKGQGSRVKGRGPRVERIGNR